MTREFAKIDKKRGDLGMETVLPLTSHEKEKYVEIISMKMVKFELRMIVEKAFMLIMTSFYIIGIVAADFFLFWFLSIIHFSGSQEQKFEDISELNILG